MSLKILGFGKMGRFVGKTGVKPLFGRRRKGSAAQGGRERRRTSHARSERVSDDIAVPGPGAGIVAVDLFCGAGGLTHGLELAGVDVRLGVDLDRHCEYPYTRNNGARFLPKSIVDVAGAELRDHFGGSEFRLVAGCAPCQPFSTYSQARKASDDTRWNLLGEFGRLVTECDANLVTMENVPQLVRERVFGDFVRGLTDAGFHVTHEVVECVRFGVPQARRRLVLLASRFGPIRLVEPDEATDTSVRHAIAHLSRIAAGGRSPDDPLHASSDLSPLNMERIRASKPGGTWRDWPERLVARCHTKATGKTYPGVYGRMVWDAPSPTITTQYFGFGNGRFGHPEQDRGLSLREGALLQSFPPDYDFVEDGKPVEISVLGRMIGNAVPVNLGRAIGTSFVRHVAELSTPS